MLVNDLKGNVFDHLHDAKAFAHGVNTKGVMGSGVAKPVKENWPELYRKYRNICLNGDLKPAMVWPYKTPSGLLVYNLATQDNPGPNAREEWVVQCVSKMVLDAQKRGIARIVTVPLGCGIGRLNWDSVKPQLEAIDSSVVLDVYHYNN